MRTQPCHSKKVRSWSAQTVSLHECALEREGERATDSPEKRRAYYKKEKESDTRLRSKEDDQRTLEGSAMKRSSPSERVDIVYEIWPAAIIIELQHRRRQDSLRISASDQFSFQAGVGPHIGASSFADGQCRCKVIELQKHPLLSPPTELERSGNQDVDCDCGPMTIGTDPRGKRLVPESSASTIVSERLRMIASSRIMEEVDRAVECRWWAHISKSAKSCTRMA